MKTSQGGLVSRAASSALLGSDDEEDKGMIRPNRSTPSKAPARKLTGLDAWNQVVGNSVTGKTDDDEAITEYYLKNGKVKQLIDDETNNGEWTLKGQQICFLYDGDDDDDQECYKLEVVGDIATFIDSDGKGRRYTILKGNPKNL